MIDSPVELVFDSMMGPRVGEIVMVWVVENAPDVLNTTVSGAVAFGARLAGLALVLRLAQAIAARSVPMSVESVVVLTW